MQTIKASSIVSAMRGKLYGKGMRRTPLFKAITALCVVNMAATGLAPAVYAANLPQMSSGYGAGMNVKGQTLTIDGAQGSGSSFTWDQGFNIGQGYTVQFQNIGTAVNKDTSGALSSILGNLFSSGAVYILNPNGILFGSSAVVDVHGLIAAAVGSVSKGPDGEFVFSKLGSGSVVNQGSISAGDFAYLVGRSVENSGSISAKDVALAAFGGTGADSLTIASAENGAKITFNIPDDAIVEEDDGEDQGGEVAISGTITGVQNEQQSQNEGGRMKLAATPIPAADAEGNISIAAATVSVEQDVSAKNVNVTGSSSVNIGKLNKSVTISATENIEAEAQNGNLNVYGSLDAGGDISLKATQGITLSAGRPKGVSDPPPGHVVAGGKVDMEAGGNISVNNNNSVTSTGTDKDVTMTAAGSITVSGDVETGGKVGMHSTSGYVSINSDVTGGSIDLSAKEQIQLSNRKSITANNGDIEAKADKNITVGGSVTASGDVDMKAATTFRLSGTTTESASIEGASVTLDANDYAGALMETDPPIASSKINSTDGNVIITGKASSAFDAAIESVGGDIAITIDNGNIDLKGSVDGGQNDVTITAGGDTGTINNDAAISGGNISITAKEVTAGENGSIEGDKLGLTVESFNQDTSVSTIAIDARGTGGNIVVNNAKSLTIGSVNNIDGLTTADGSITVTTAGDLTVAKDITANGGNVALTANLGDSNKGVIKVDDSTVSASGNINLQAAKGVSIDPSTLDADGNLTITATEGDVVIDAGSEAKADGNLTITATAGNINAEGKLVADGAGKTTTLTAANGAIDAQNAANDFATVEAVANGNINLVDKDDLVISKAATTAGNVEVTAGGTMTVQNDGVSTAGDATLTTTAATGDINVDADVAATGTAALNAGRNIRVRNGDVTAVAVDLDAVNFIEVGAGRKAEATAGDLTAVAGGNITVKGTAKASDAVALTTSTATKSIKVDGANALVQGKSVTLDASQGLSAQILNGGKVATTAGDATLKGGTYALVNGDITAVGGDAVIETTAETMTVGGSTVQAGIEVDGGTIQGDNVNFTSGGSILTAAGTALKATAGDVTLTAQGEQTTSPAPLQQGISLGGTTTASGSVKAEATKGSFQNTGAITATPGDVRLLANKDVDVEGVVTASAGDICIAADDGQVVVGKAVSGVNVTLAAKDDITEDAAVSATADKYVFSADGDITVTTPGTVDGNAAYIAQNGAINDGEVAAKGFVYLNGKNEGTATAKSTNGGKVFVKSGNNQYESVGGGISYETDGTVVFTDADTVAFSGDSKDVKINSATKGVKIGTVSSASDAALQIAEVLPTTSPATQMNTLAGTGGDASNVGGTGLKAKKVTVNVAGDVTQDSGAVVVAHGNTSITATGHDIKLAEAGTDNDFQGTVTASGASVSLKDKNAINIAAVTATSGNANIEASGNVNVLGAVKAENGEANLTTTGAGKSIKIAGAGSSVTAKAVTLDASAGKSVQVVGGTVTATDGDATATAREYIVVGQGSVSAAKGTAKLETTDGQTLSEDVGASDFKKDMLAGVIVAQNGAVSGKNVEITSAGSVLVDASSAVTATPVSSEGGTIKISANGTTEAVEPMANGITTAGQVTKQGAYIDGTVTANGADDGAAKALTVTSAKDIYIGGTVEATAMDGTEGKGSVKATATAGNIQVPGTISATKTANLTATAGSITDDGTTISHGVAETAPWAKEASVFSAHVTAKDAVLKAKSIGEAASGAVGGKPLDTEVETIDATATAGSVYVWEKDAIEVKNLSATKGNAELENLEGNITLSGTASATKDGNAYGNVLLGAKTGNLVLGKVDGENIIGGTVSAGNAASLLAGGNIDQNANVTAASVDAQAFGNASTITLRKNVQTEADLVRYVAKGGVTLNENAVLGKEGATVIVNGSLTGDGNVTAETFGIDGANLGAANAPMKLSVSTLAAKTTGDVFVENDKALTIGTAAAGNAGITRVHLDGETSPVGGVSAGNEIKGITAQNGNVSILTDGKMTVNEAVNAGANAVLETTVGGIELNDTVTAGQNATVLAKAGVKQNAGGAKKGDITATAGDAYVEAQGGDVEMADGTATTAGGNARVAASANVKLSSVKAENGNVSVVATAGDIMDNTAAETANITAKKLRLEAGKAIGGAVAADIDTSVDNVELVANEGDAFLQNDKALEIGNVGDVTAKKVLVVDATTTDVTDTNLEGTKAASADTGDIRIEAAGNLTVSEAVATTARPTGNDADKTGNIRLESTSGDMAVNAAVSGNNVTLASDGKTEVSAGNKVGASKDLYVKAGGNIVLNATDADKAEAGETMALVSDNGAIDAKALKTSVLYTESKNGTTLTGAEVTKQAKSNSDGDIDAEFVGDATVAYNAGGHVKASATGKLTVDSAEDTDGSIKVTEVVKVEEVTDANNGVKEVDLVAADGGADSVEGVTAGTYAALQGTEVTVNQAVAANGGNAVLESTTGAVNLNKSVTASQNVTVNAKTAVNQNAGGDITATAGAAYVEAQGGDVTMADGTTTTAGGNARVAASGNVKLSSVKAENGDVSVVATAGDITDNTAAETANITAKALRIEAGKAIGGANAENIDTSVDNVELVASDGDAFVHNAKGVTIGNVGDVTVQKATFAAPTTMGDVPDANLEGAKATAGNLSVLADGTMKISEAVSAEAEGKNVVLEAANDPDGNAGDVIIGKDADGNVVATATVKAGQHATVVATGAVDQNADIKAGGDAWVEAQGGNVTMKDGTTTEAKNKAYVAATGDTGDVELSLVKTTADNGVVSVYSKNGSIKDNLTVGETADTEKANIVAQKVRLEAGAAVGATDPNDIETTADNLEIKAGTGAFVHNTKTVTIGGVGDVTVKKVATATAVAAETAAGGDLVGAKATAGNLSILADGQMTVAANEAVEAGANAVLQTTAGGIELNDTVTAGQNATILAKTAVDQNADITATADDAYVEAQGGDVTMADGTKTEATAGSARVAASGSVKLSSVKAENGNVSVVATAGDITDNTVAENANIVAKNLRLEAGAAIGEVRDVANDENAGDIETTADNIEILAGKDAFVHNTKAVTVGEVNGVTVQKVVTADATTVDVTDADLNNGQAGAKATAGNLSVLADGKMTVAENEAVNAGANAVLQTTAGGIKLNAGVTARQNATVVAAGAIDQNADITTTAGDAYVEAKGGDVTMKDGSTTVATKGNARVRASGNVAISSVKAAKGNASIKAGGDITDNTAAETANITAKKLRLEAGKAIGGANAGNIDTSVDKIELKAKNDVYVHNDKALTVGGVNSVTVKKVNVADGVAAAAPADEDLTGAKSTSGDIRLIANGNLTGAKAEAIDANGDMRLESKTGAVTLNDTVTAGKNLTIASNGKMTANKEIKAKEGDLYVKAGGDIDIKGGATANDKKGVMALVSKNGKIVANYLNADTLYANAKGNVKPGAMSVKSAVLSTEGTFETTLEKNTTLSVSAGKDVIIHANGKELTVGGSASKDGKALTVTEVNAKDKTDEITLEGTGKDDKAVTGIEAKNGDVRIGKAKDGEKDEIKAKEITGTSIVAKKGDVEIGTTGDYSVKDTSAGGRADLDIGGSVQGGANVSAKGETNIKADGSVDAGSISGSPVIVNAGGSFKAKAVKGGSIKVTAGSAEFGEADGGRVEVTANGGIKTTGKGIASSDLTLKGGDVIVTLDSKKITSISGGNVEITEKTKDDNVTLGDISASGNLTLTASQIGIGNHGATGYENGSLSAGRDINLFVSGHMGSPSNPIEIKELGGKMTLRSGDLHSTEDGDLYEGNGNMTRLNFFYLLMEDAGANLSGKSTSSWWEGYKDDNGKPIPGIVLLGSKLLAAAPGLMNKIYRALAFTIETPELKSKQGVFGAPLFVHTDMDVSEAASIGTVDYVNIADTVMDTLADPDVNDHLIDLVEEDNDPDLKKRFDLQRKNPLGRDALYSKEIKGKDKAAADKEKADKAAAKAKAKAEKAAAAEKAKAEREAKRQADKAAAEKAKTEKAKAKAEAKASAKADVAKK